MLKKQKLTAAVAIAMGGFGMAASVAQAGVVYFPYVVGSDTVTTIISIINTEGSTPRGVNDKLHYTFYSKTLGEGETEADLNAKGCNEWNQYLPTSKNDIVTFDLAGTFAGAASGVMFQDASTATQPRNDGYTGAGQWDMGAEYDPFRGYMVVEHAADMTLTNGTSTGGLYGEAIIFEFGSGASWGYQAMANVGQESATGMPANTQYDFRRFASASPSYVPLFPVANESDPYTTKFMVTPLWTPNGVPNMMPTTSGTGDDNVNAATISMTAADFAESSAAIFDRDENPISGSSPKEVVCVGAVMAEDLVSISGVSNLGQGGWAGVTNYSTFGPFSTSQADLQEASNCESSIDRNEDYSYSCSATAVLFKVEFGNTDAIGGLPETTGGTYNNAILLSPHPWIDLR